MPFLTQPTESREIGLRAATASKTESFAWHRVGVFRQCLYIVKVTLPLFLQQVPFRCIENILEHWEIFRKKFESSF